VTARILILEDTEERILKFKHKLIGREVTVCKTADECIKVLTSEPPFDYIMLDHDLSIEFSKPGKGTGYEVAAWIADNPHKSATQRIFIHSLNNVGAAAMMRKLGDANIRATYVPWLWEKLEMSRLPNEHEG